MSHSPPRNRLARKLLTASLGVATLSYVTAVTSCGGETGAVDASPGDERTGPGPVVGNLAPGPTDAQKADVTGAIDATQPDVREEFIVGNLAPIPIDAHADGTPADVTTDTGSDVTTDTSSDVLTIGEHFIGNLAPPPQDH
jgi:hypothetical protein